MKRSKGKQEFVADTDANVAERPLLNDVLVGLRPRLRPSPWLVNNFESARAKIRNRAI